MRPVVTLFAFEVVPSYTNGFYTCRDADVFVTRGLGGMVRILNRPEVAVVILRRN